ncbi:hypothetical protein DIS24_g1290 [Lasiodiplodia hormozganensis]|uniref:Uncharacterized protein n=1 Tax=Lasiodiplodia hormozganensis TaxID=869390 RepID=A0AA40D4T9_9PEZI|nr:hypothetical protein DIS24_g1290 [Lasiodiplodia hormozganensis]
MNPVGYVNDYEQWAQDANRGQTMRLASAAAAVAATAAAAAAAPKPAPEAVEAAQAQQLSGTQTDNDRDRYHTYYYRPRSDSSINSSYYYAWPRNYGYYYGGPGYHNTPYSHEHNWYGRTASEVYQDNVAYVMHHRGMAPRRGDQEMVPRDPRDDQMFYVRELDGQWTLRSFATIENDLRPGYWDTHQGRAYFVRTRE